MTPDLLTLAASAVALPGWRWMPGMLLTTGDRVCSATVYADGGILLYLGDGSELTNEFGDEWRRLTGEEGGERDDAADAPLPDLADDATGGCMLDLLGEERASVYPWSDGFRWNLIHSQPFSEALPLGVACAQVAVARGRWAA